jgi:hypothetical protein
MEADRHLIGYVKSEIIEMGSGVIYTLIKKVFAVFLGHTVS